MDLLLKLKHWQIFLTLVLGIVIFDVIVFSVLMKDGVDDDNAFAIIFLFTAFIWLFAYFIYGWQYAIIKRFKKHLPSDVKINFGRVNTFFYIPMVYLILLSFIFLSAAIGKIPILAPEYIDAWQLVIPIHLISAFGIFHTMYFSANVLKSVEMRRDTRFGDFAGEFFLMWFWIIGIWILQPRINKIHSGDVDDTDILDDILDDKL